MCYPEKPTNSDPIDVPTLLIWVSTNYSHVLGLWRNTVFKNWYRKYDMLSKIDVLKSNTVCNDFMCCRSDITIVLLEVVGF